MQTVSLNKVFHDMIAENPAIGAEMLESAVNALLFGDADEGRILFRQYVNATIGFRELAHRTGLHEKSLMRMFGSHGNPSSANLAAIIRACAEEEKTEMKVVVA